MTWSKENTTFVRMKAWAAKVAEVKRKIKFLSFISFSANGGDTISRKPTFLPKLQHWRCIVFIFFCAIVATKREWCFDLYLFNIFILAYYLYIEDDLFFVMDISRTFYWNNMTYFLLQRWRQIRCVCVCTNEQGNVEYEITDFVHISQTTP